MTERTAYKLSEVRAALNIGRSTMYRWIKNGKLEVTRLGGRSFVKREALKGLMDGSTSHLQTSLQIKRKFNETE
jgi:excisionase family DNA binding protein